jgi:hypothetical protein
MMDGNEPKQLIRDAALFAQGLAEGLLWAAEVAALPAENASAEKPNEVPGTRRAPPKTTRAQVVRPILNILRTANRPLRINEIMQAGRAIGFDLLRNSVSNALNKLAGRGIVAKDGHAYYILPLDPEER